MFVYKKYFSTLCLVRSHLVYLIISVFRAFIALPVRLSQFTITRAVGFLLRSLIFCERESCFRFLPTNYTVYMRLSAIIRCHSFHNLKWLDVHALASLLHTLSVTYALWSSYHTVRQTEVDRQTDRRTPVIFIIWRMLCYSIGQWTANDVLWD